MSTLPPHIQEYIEQSPYGPFTEVELTRLARRLHERVLPATEEYVEYDLLAMRAVFDPTVRNIAVFNNAIALRAIAQGRPVGPVCSCGWPVSLFDIDGPNPLQRICCRCGAPVSEAEAAKST